ncbi:MAG: hypothetical protein L7F77_16045, partial [Candidatus Magnetominusculus sp. LBB02]|nr:hypothetical protein [Candidatus Magnetominusculus sp. LBB02]
MRVRNLTVTCAVSLVAALVVYSVFKGMAVNVIFNADALIIVVGGTIIGMLLGFPIDRLKSTFRDIVKSFKDKSTKESLMDEILHLARVYRNSG